MKKCDMLITRAKTNTDTEDWDEKDLQTVNYIYF